MLDESFRFFMSDMVFLSPSLKKKKKLFTGVVESHTIVRNSHSFLEGIFAGYKIVGQ